jgi:hypothetical protein
VKFLEAFGSASFDAAGSALAWHEDELSGCWWQDSPHYSTKSLCKGVRTGSVVCRFDCRRFASLEVQNLLEDLHDALL